jgi:Sortase domain
MGGRRILAGTLKVVALLAFLGGAMALVGTLVHREAVPSGRAAETAPIHTSHNGTKGMAGVGPTCAPIDRRLQQEDPCRVAIPAIGVDAKVTWLGLNGDGTLQVPTDYSLTGWWSGGQQPGERGPTVIVGHVDGRSGPAVFYHLGRLQSGDLVKVWRVGDAQPVVYRVVDIGEWPKTAFPTQKVYGQTADPTLRLITCGGAFNQGTGHYVDNVIVFANLVSAPRGS